MNGWRQGWLVARREMRERTRTRAFWVSVVLMVLAVASINVLPAVVVKGGSTKHVGLAGTVPRELAATVQAQGRATGYTLVVDRYATAAAGEQALRDKHIDVLVVDARRLEWPRHADDKLKAVVTSAIQLDAVRTRASAAGMTPGALSALLAPVPVQNEELGAAPGRSPDDETVALVTAGLLLFCIATFGALVLSGVVEEKASRVVEVLLTRIPARSLLAGKIAGIGLLGLAQIAVVAIVALVATSTVSSVNLPSVRASVAVWVLVWFVLGYCLYATAFGTLGSLASRVEDAQSVAGPVSVLLIAAYFVSFAAIGSPTTRWATAVSLIPLTAPMAMPGRIAMGAAAWWEPTLAVVLTLATIAALVYFGGRLYVRAVLHSGATLNLREAWHLASANQPTPTTPGQPRSRVRAGIGTLTARRPSMIGRHEEHPVALTLIICLGVAVGVAVAVLSHDVIVGVMVGALLIAVPTQLMRLWSGHGKVRHP